MRDDFTVKVVYIGPPIPVRECDWGAYVDGYEEDGISAYGDEPWTALRELADTLEDECYRGSSG